MAAFGGGEALSGMAGEIRSSIESDQFDLAGFTEEKSTNLVQNKLTKNSLPS